MHVERDDNEAKFWLDPVRLQRNAGFRAAELGTIQGMVETRQTELLEAWNGFFNG